MRRVSSSVLLWLVLLGAVLACGASSEAESSGSSSAVSSAAPGAGGFGSSAPGLGSGGGLGMSDAGNDGGFAACATASVPAERVPLDLLVVMDKSGSMVP